MPHLDLSGLTIPLVTPFQNDKKASVDFKKLTKLVDYLINKQKADALVAIGTTGESTSLTHEEKEAVIRHTIEAADGRVPVIAGTGSSCTEEAIGLTRFSEKAGAAGVLVVSPYYIRPNQDGLYNHFLKIAKSTDLPVILYNHPGRTGVSIELNTLIKLANATKNIVGIKDCPNSLLASTDLARRAHKEIKRPFAVLTGEDDTIFVNLCLGADGAISATGHLVGVEIKNLIKAFRKGDIAKAREIQFSIIDLQRMLFQVPSPAPIKAALDILGTGLGGSVRPPLVDGPKEFLVKLKDQLRKTGKI
ncbi:MAG: 4-hydroxy-tetrahydrodipicolinate synthase [Bdellovibrionales bacterium]